MLTFTPKRKVKAAGGISLFLMIAAVALFALASFDIFSARSVIQLIAVVFATAAIFILAKYVIMSFSYSLCEGNDGSYDLLISQVSGKKVTTVCRIAVSDIVEVKRIPRGDKAYKGAYSYVAELLPRELLLLKIDDLGSVFYVKLQTDDAFEKALTEIIKGEKNF